MYAKIGNKASITIQMIGTKSWKVIKLHEENNHDLIAKDETFTLRSH